MTSIHSKSVNKNDFKFRFNETEVHEFHELDPCGSLDTPDGKRNPNRLSSQMDIDLTKLNLKNPEFDDEQNYIKIEDGEGGDSKANDLYDVHDIYDNEESVESMEINIHGVDDLDPLPMPPKVNLMEMGHESFSDFNASDVELANGSDGKVKMREISSLNDLSRQRSNKSSKLNSFENLASVQFGNASPRKTQNVVENSKDMLIKPDFKTFKAEGASESNFKKNGKSVNIDIPNIEIEEIDATDTQMFSDMVDSKRNIYNEPPSNTPGVRKTLIEVFNLLTLCKKTYAYKKDLLKHLLVKIPFISSKMRESMYRGVVDPETSVPNLLQFEKSTYTVLSDREVQLPFYDKFSKKDKFKQQLNANFLQSRKTRKGTFPDQKKQIRLLDCTPGNHLISFEKTQAKEEWLKEPELVPVNNAENQWSMEEIQKIMENQLSVISERSSNKEMHDDSGFRSVPNKEVGSLKTSLLQQGNEGGFGIKGSTRNVPSRNPFLKKAFGTSISEFEAKSHLGFGSRFLCFVFTRSYIFY